MLVVNNMWIEECIPNKGSPIDREVEEPTLEQIMDALSQLDGKVTSYVMLFPADESEVYLAVSGGNDGRYVVNHWNGETGVQHNLIDPTVTSDEIVEVMIVHPSERSVRLIVDLATARKAATVYAMTGKLAEDLHWEVD